MSCLVTGVAGFVGSHLAERLVEKGHLVTGLDSFTDYYPKSLKESNLSSLRKNPNFTFVEGDLNSVNLPKLLRSVEFIFHLSGQPGVRPSWGSSFSRYVNDNVMATQRLLEICKRTKIKKLVYASSSSIYGDAERLPTPEDVIPRPFSPYGTTKLAAEHLCQLYFRNFGVPTVTLRYFTVYGPRQRPDMAFNKFITAMSTGRTLEVNGDGSQSRDFTFVDDTVSANLLAMDARSGGIFNVGSGRTIALNEALALLESIMGKKAKVIHREAAAGDVRNTSADISRIESELGYIPKMTLQEGLRRQVSWQLGMK